MREVKVVSNEDLIRISRKRPSTLYEMKALEELARRATRGEIDLPVAMELTVEACRFTRRSSADRRGCSRRRFSTQRSRRWRTRSGRWRVTGSIR